MSLAEIAPAIRVLSTRSRVIAEGAGRTPVAAAPSGKAGCRRIVFVSGGNIDAAKSCTIVEGRVP